MFPPSPHEVYTRFSQRLQASSYPVERKLCSFNPQAATVNQFGPNFESLTEIIFANTFSIFPDSRNQAVLCKYKTIMWLKIIFVAYIL